MEKNEVKVIKSDEKNENKLTVEDKLTIKELEESIAKMKEDKEAKCKLAKDQLIDMLEVTVDKYRTATGTAEALRVMRFAMGNDDVNIAESCMLAHDMAKVTQDMLSKAKKLSYAEMDQLCDGFYAKDFLVDSQSTNFVSGKQLAYEMMCIDLCRNVGGAAEDMVEFIKRTEEQIDATGKKLKELKAKEK